MAEAEGKLARFKQKYVGVLPGQGGGYYERLSSTRRELETAKLQLSEMTQRRNELKRQIAGEEPVFLSSGTDNFSRSPLDTRIQTLQAREDELLTRYTEEYPEVVQLRKLIADLEIEKQQEIEKAVGWSAGRICGAAGKPSISANENYAC